MDTEARVRVERDSKERERWKERVRGSEGVRRRAGERDRGRARIGRWCQNKKGNKKINLQLTQ